MHDARTRSFPALVDCLTRMMPYSGMLPRQINIYKTPNPSTQKPQNQKKPTALCDVSAMGVDPVLA